MNRIKFLIFFLIMMVTLSCYSEVAMQLDISRKYFIQYENIYATLKIRNLSSHPLIFGNHKQLSGKLYFLIRNEKEEKVKLRKDSQEDFLSEQILTPGKTIEVSLSLSQVYAINTPGKYSVKAVITHTQLPNSYESNLVTFHIVQGSVVWSAVVGVPTVNPIKKTDTIPKRIYELKAYFDGENKIYCLEVSDKDFVYGIARVGIDLGGKKPQCIIDGYSRIHILLENRDKTYTYYIYDVNCNLDDKEIYKADNSTPRLNLNEKNGEVEIIGGEQVLEK